MKVMPQQTERTEFMHLFGGEHDLSLAKKSCKYCYGTGKAGMYCEPQRIEDPETEVTDWGPKVQMYCSCIAKAEYELAMKLVKILEELEEGQCICEKCHFFGDEEKFAMDDKLTCPECNSTEVFKKETKKEEEPSE